MIQNFNPDDFLQFSTSTKIDGNYVGLYKGKVFRIIEKNKDDFNYLIDQLESIPHIIASEVVFQDNKRLIIEHPKLDHITYYNEWTRLQRVIAAKSIIELQENLSEIGYFLADPHAFNITFKYASPIYFDLGSIKKGKINPHWWFLKCFTGWRESDYWDDVLNISVISKLIILFRILFSNNPYEYLKKKIAKYESPIIEKIFKHFISHTKVTKKIFQIINRALPVKFTTLTNWTEYNQKNPSSNTKNIRTINILEIIKNYKPLTLIDIGANKGAYSILALKNGVKEAICIDLDQHSLNCLFNETKDKGWKIYSVLLNIMKYNEAPGKYKSYLAAPERLSCDFGLCLAIVHHVCYFGNSSFDEFAEKINRFVKDTLIIEFIPYDDIHLRGAIYKGKDRSWYTQENFINVFRKYYPGKLEIFESFPKPRVLIKFSK